MRVFGLSLILIGVVVAGVGLLSGTTSRYAQTAKTDVGFGRQQGEASQSPRISAAVVMVAPASRIAPAPPFADPATALVDQPTLVRDLQRELARLGCYDGAINGMWTAPSRQAMVRLIDRINARLPTQIAEPAHLALAKGQSGRVCDRCPAGKETTAEGQCVQPRAGPTKLAGVVAHPHWLPRPTPQATQDDRVTVQPRPSRRGRPIEGRMTVGVGPVPITKAVQPRPSRRGRPIEGRMAVGVGPVPITKALSPEARLAAALPQKSQPSTRQRRAERHRHRVAGVRVRPRYFRPIRPVRYVYRRPHGLLSFLFGF
jgi:hypothetical protein